MDTAQFWQECAAKGDSHVNPFRDPVRHGVHVEAGFPLVKALLIIYQVGQENWRCVQTDVQNSTLC